MNSRPDDENKLDTARIQHALDSCGKGKGLMLRANGIANAFLSGPLELREGVTLIVDKGATLFASRDPAIFEKTPGSCGLVNELGSGCTPDVLLTDSAVYKYAIHHADLVFGPGPVNLKPEDRVDWTLEGKSGSGKPESCAEKFVPFPHE